MNENESSASRRDDLKLTLLGFVSSLPVTQALAKTKKETTEKKPYLFFNPHEAQFIEAATARLIPADEQWGGALEANVPHYIDLQLAGSWGAGERLYRSGPWQAGTPSQGYQLPFTPSEFFRTAMRALLKEFETKKIHFHHLSPEEQDSYLKELEKSERDLDGISAKSFFAALLQMTIEGFFADPVYGGNKDMISWRMIGFPGAAASYSEVVDKHGIRLNRPPVSLAQDGLGHVHVNPNIPATIPGKSGK